MCGRFSLAADQRSLELRFSFRGLDQPVVPQYNVAPTQQALTVTSDGQGNHGQYMRWGLIPFWAKDSSIGSRMINARAETLSEKPSFKYAFRKRRCLVLADGFYEWQKTAGHKRPMRITLKSGKPFAFAGLWESWKDPQNGVVQSCTIVTTGANELMGPIHDRMPVILSERDEPTWLDTGTDDQMKLASLLKPYSAVDMDAYEVSSRINSPSNNVPECLERVTLL